jgi:hypothetical protein
MRESGSNVGGRKISCLQVMFYLSPSVCDDASSSVGFLASVFSAFDASLVVADGSF